MAPCALGLWLLGCGAGPTDFEPPPPALHVVQSEPRPGQGLECAPPSEPECGVPINTSITLRFDRYLRASTAVRQSISVYTGRPENSVGLLLPEYDAVERVVVYRLTQALEPRTLYTVELGSAQDSASYGFQAFDGAPLEASDVPLKFNFYTRQSVQQPPVVPLEPIPTCDRILEILNEAGCTTVGCHGGKALSMGLALDTADALNETAIRRVARQTELGAVYGVPLEDPARFGLQMPVIDPGQPGNSYLLYKILQNEQSFWMAEDDPGLCSSRYTVGLGPQCVPPSHSERARLREWFVRGAPMPPDDATLFRPEVREIQRFIAAGASCP